MKTTSRLYIDEAHTALNIFPCASNTTFVVLVEGEGTQILFQSPKSFQAKHFQFKSYSVQYTAISCKHPPTSLSWADGKQQYWKYQPVCSEGTMLARAVALQLLIIQLSFAKLLQTPASAKNFTMLSAYFHFFKNKLKNWQIYNKYINKRMLSHKHSFISNKRI